MIQPDGADGSATISSDDEAMRRLHALSMRLASSHGMGGMLNDILDAVIAMQGAECGHIELHDAATGRLRIAAQRGSAHECLPTQSTPLFNADGQVIGMLSTRFGEPRELTDVERRLTGLYASVASAFIEVVPLVAAIESLRVRYRDDAWLMQTADMMERQLAHVVRIVDDLMDVGRTRSGRIRLRRARVPLSEVVQAALEECRPVIEAKRHRLVLEPSREDLLVDVDFDRMVQVVSNILANAAKYTEIGGRIVVSASRQGAEAALAIADTGIGIPAAELALVQGIVALHGGCVTAESAGPGKGSRFIVRLPLAMHVIDVGKAPREGAAGLRVLLADDNADAVDSLASLLRADGYEVAVARDGLEALEKAAEARPDAVLMDIVMPHMDGFEAARRLRQSHGGSVFLVALTGWDGEKDRERTREAGFDAHLVKPVELDSLRRLFAGIRAGPPARIGAC